MTVEAGPVLRAEGVRVEFPVGGTRRGRVVHAVDDVSIELWAGQVTAVVGESGSGKSTLARALCRLITPKAGRLWLDGTEVPFTSRRGAREYRREVQLILQDPFSSLNPIHTIAYHLSRPLKIHKRGGASLTGTVDGLLERVNLSPVGRYRDRLPHELSGGQLQRVAIARALAVGPRVLLADEPVSMLDVSIRLGVLNLLGELCADDRLAALYVTHDIASARYLATTVVVMYAGRVVEAGPAEQVVDRPAHPYTQLLLSAAPDPERLHPPELAGRGSPPSLIDPPSGCRFHPRCPLATARCAEEVPPAVEVELGRTVSCWNVSAPRVAPGSRGA
ncbi:MAG: ABC transporter ATP-binding protein [Acidobacteriota bacterium]|nr:ABC transporter ATP-binding protein [Acidobacteriota bacterium]